MKILTRINLQTVSPHLVSLHDRQPVEEPPHSGDGRPLGLAMEVERCALLDAAAAGADVDLRHLGEGGRGEDDDGGAAEEAAGAVEDGAHVAAAVSLLKSRARVRYHVTR